MKIKEFIKVPKLSLDTTSSGTIYSISSMPEAQDIVPQNNVPEKNLTLEVDSHPDHSAITEGVSQILRRSKKGGAPTTGFRCTTGPRKGRIVAKPSTCFSRIDLKKGSRIKRKRLAKARLTGKKTAQTKRTGAGSLRLKGAQIKKKGQKGKSTAPRVKGKGPVKSKVVRPKK